MNCQNCGVSHANFHYKANINGQLSEWNLCTKCASALQNSAFAGRTMGLGTFSNMFPESLFGKFALGEPFLENRRSAMRPEASAYFPSAPQVVPEPGETKIPLEADDALKARRQLNQLRAELKSAVEAQDFESAAALRDEIFHLEQAQQKN